MDMVNNGIVNGGSGGRRRARPTALPSVDKKQKRAPKAVTVLAAAGLIAVSGLAGALLERRHFHAHQVVAAVNGEPIDAAAFDGRLQDAAGNSVIRQMVDESLQLQFAKKMGTLPTDAQVDSLFNEATQRPNYADALLRMNESPEQYKRALRLELAQANLLGKGVNVTDTDLHRFYQHNIDPRSLRPRYYTADQARLEIVVTPTQDLAQQAVQDLARGLAFGTVAKKYSKDAVGAATGGVTRMLTRGASPLAKVPGLEDAAFGLKIGQQIGPVHFGKAWWIIHCLDRKPAIAESYSSVKNDCRVMVTLAKGVSLNGKKAQDQFTQFRKDASVQAFWPQYTDAIRQ